MTPTTSVSENLQSQRMPVRTHDRKAEHPLEKILVVEDDRAVQKALARLFGAEGYNIRIADNGEAALEAFKEAVPDLVILDLRLPGMSGHEICREIRKQARSLPIIILSAKTDVVDKVLLLEVGADDYVTKPFSPRELLARVRAALRRFHQPAGPEDLCAFGDVAADFTKMEVTRDGHPVELTAQEFKLLKYFAENAGRVISRDELLSHVWGYQSYPSTRTVDNHVLRLRQKLEKDPANPAHFHTVHRAGYKFVR